MGKPAGAARKLTRMVRRFLKEAEHEGFLLQDVLAGLAKVFEDEGIIAGQEGDKATYKYLIRLAGHLDAAAGE